MLGLKRIAQGELDALKNMRRVFQNELDCLPEGTLGSNTSRGKTYLRWWKKGSNKTVPLSMKEKNDIILATALRRRRFVKEMLKVIDNNIKALMQFTKNYIELDPKGIRDNLSRAYQIPPGQEKEEIPGFHPHKANEANYKSKSEEICALVLESYNLEAMYEYEIIANGKVYKPDFTIIDPRNGQLVFFEHFGRPELPGYYEDMVRRLIDYWYEGIRIGKNLIVTFETEEEPLTIGQVQLAVDQFFGTSNR